ncbi:hypothetical protein D4765_08315 [Subtercola vilae]|uniref:Uncharacterized protein n=1 Tax=Subtercola vilae TaxID=2056433 RepID=A0A4T2C0H0_9MICO|nr:hypothetical protein D4765_08315 [Subtercola vilae]
MTGTAPTLVPAITAPPIVQPLHDDLQPLSEGLVPRPSDLSQSSTEQLQNAQHAIDSVRDDLAQLK